MEKQYLSRFQNKETMSSLAWLSKTIGMFDQ